MLQENSFWKKCNWLTPFAILFLCFITYRAAESVRDSDIFFMVANGDYIVHHGFPKYNPFVIYDGFKIVIQQWIPSVIAYWGYPRFEWAFLVAETLFGLSLLIFALYKLISLEQPKQKSFLTASILVSLMLYLYFGKPMLYSMILLVFQLYVCEKGASWLWIPFIVLLEANIHASFIAFHFVYLLPYIVPGLTRYLKNTAKYKYIKSLPLMMVAALINPYGLSGALYLFNSYNDNLTDLTISELDPMPLISFSSFVCIFMVLFIGARLKLPVDSAKFYTFMGSCLLVILFPQIRNYIFLVVGSVPLLSIELPSAKGKKVPPKSIMWGLAACAVAATIIFFPTKSNYYMRPVKIADYLEGKECVLFNEFSQGPYYEMRGIKVFTDSRPELYFKSINGKETVIGDFTDIISEDNEKIERVRNKYNFTHYSTYKGTYLEKYLKKRGYKVVAKDGRSVLLTK